MNPQVLSSIDQFVAPESTQVTQKDTDRRHTSTTGVHGSWGIGEQGREREREKNLLFPVNQRNDN